METTTLCRHVRGGLVARLRHELDDGAARELDSHLTGCPACREEALSLAATLRAFDAACEEAPPLSGDFAVRVAARLETAPASSANNNSMAGGGRTVRRWPPVVAAARFRWRPATVASLAAHAAAAAVIVGLLATRPPAPGPVSRVGPEPLPVEPVYPAVPLDAASSAWLAVYRAREDAPRVTAAVRPAPAGTAAGSADRDGGRGCSLSLAALPVGSSVVRLRPDGRFGFVRVYAVDADESGDIEAELESAAPDADGAYLARLVDGRLSLSPELTALLGWDFADMAAPAADGSPSDSSAALVFLLSDRLEIWSRAHWRGLSSRFSSPAFARPDQAPI